MMPDKQEPVGAAGILELIATLFARGESGRLDIVAGATEGALLFKNGKLVDARIGHLTGFQAINAVASMRDARFHFDPSVGVPTFSPITSSERLVLKQFFGIETVDSTDYSTPVIAEEVEEVTLVTSNSTSAPTGPSTSYQAGSRAPYIIAFALSVLVIALATAAVRLRHRFREQSSPASVATRIEPASRPIPAEATVNEKPIATGPDLTGKWHLVNTVHNTSYRSFQNMKIGFALSINQTGTTFTAKGEKVSENGRSLPASSRTPIQLQGFIDGDRIEATFFEQGAIRKTNGRVVWKIDRTSGGLTGTFASTAAQTTGKSTARREL
jgi:hypothetical protein